MTPKRVPVAGFCCEKIATISKDYDGMIDYIDISSVDNLEKRIVTYQSIEAKEAPSRAKQLIQKGDILVSTVRPNLNAVAIVDSSTENLMVCSTGYCVLRSNETIDNRFLFYFCQSNYFVDDMTSQATGASYPAVNSGIVRKSLIPLYLLEQQKKISEVFDQVSHLIRFRNNQLSKLDELVKSRFIEMFGDPEHNEKGLPTLPMTDLCEIIDGDRGKNYPKQEEFSEEGFCLFLNAKNVTSNGFLFENCMYITEKKDSVLRNGKLNRGDVVLTTRGTLGNMAFYDESIPYEHMRINSGMVILRMKRDRITERFFIEQFKMQLASIKERIASGSAQPQLPISTMNKIVMLVPDVDLQNQFAIFVEQIDKLKHEVRQSLEKLETLKKSLMQKYFG